MHIDLMLVHCLRHWTNISLTLVQYIVFYWLSNQRPLICSLPTEHRTFPSCTSGSKISTYSLTNPSIIDGFKNCAKPSVKDGCRACIRVRARHSSQWIVAHQLECPFLHLNHIIISEYIILFKYQTNKTK